MITINDVKPYATNVKNHPDKQIDIMAKVIMEIGWRQSVEVNQEGTIVAGHGRWLVWEKYKNDPKMPPIWIIDDMGNNIHGEHDKRPLTKDQETMWRIADNKLSEMAEWDLVNFNYEFASLPDSYKEVTGFNNFDELGEIDEQEWGGILEKDFESEEGIVQSIVVHFKKETDILDFVKATGIFIDKGVKRVLFNG